MKKLIVLAAAASLAAIAAPAFAASNVSVGYSNYKAGDFNMGGFTGRIGWGGDLIAFEGEATVGVTPDSSGTGAARVSDKLNSEFAGFAIVHHELNSQVDIFGRIGMAVTDFNMRLGSGGTSVHGSHRDAGLAYGAGATFMFSNSNGIRGDYEVLDTDAVGINKTSNLARNHAENSDIWSISLVHKFAAKAAK